MKEKDASSSGSASDTTRVYKILKKLCKVSMQMVKAKFLL